MSSNSSGNHENISPIDVGNARLIIHTTRRHTILNMIHWNVTQMSVIFLLSARTWEGNHQLTHELMHTYMNSQKGTEKTTAGSWCYFGRHRCRECKVNHTYHMQTHAHSIWFTEMSLKCQWNFIFQHTREKATINLHTSSCTRTWIRRRGQKRQLPEAGVTLEEKGYLQKTKRLCMPFLSYGFKRNSIRMTCAMWYF